MKDKKIIDAWDKLNPNADEKLRIMEKVREGQGIDKRRGISVRSLLIAVVILVLGTVSVVAYNSEVRRIMFGESVATEVEVVNMPNMRRTIITSDGYYVTFGQSRLRVYNPSLRLYERLGSDYRGFPFAPLHIYIASYSTFEDDTTIDESNQRTMFTIKEPIAYLTTTRRGSEMRLFSHSLFYLIGDDYAYGTFLIYYTGGEIVDSTFWAYSFSLGQWYAGEGGYFEVETTSPIEKIMINDTEALLIEHVLEEDDRALLFSRTMYGREMAHREIIWMKDGVVYVLSGFSGVRGFTHLDLETLIDIAKSIR